MAHAHTADHQIENPGALKGGSVLTGVFGVCIAIGLISFFLAYSTDPIQAWTAFLKAHFYFMSIAMGALFFIVIQWLTTAMWSAPVIRVAEGITAYLPFVLISTLILFCGNQTLFQWTHLDIVQNDPVIQGKAGYLNLTFFIIRTLVAVVGWIWFQRKLVGGSLSVDQGTPYRKVYETNRMVGVAFLMFFAITYTMSAFDELMSLDPHFFSTMFGVYVFAGSWQAFFATFAIVTILMKRAGYLSKVMNENHLHDIAKWMFAFTVFWAYTGFSQYMLIWYANLPEETGYFILRFNQHWEGWTMALFIGRFFVPFFLLIPRGNKRNETFVFCTAVWILIMHYLDLNWLVQPQFFEDGPRFTFADIGLWLGFFGAFGLMIMRFYKKHNVVAMNNPYLADSVHHHHI